MAKKDKIKVLRRAKKFFDDVLFKAKSSTHSDYLLIPNYDSIVSLNKIALVLYPDKKSDQHEVLNEKKIRRIVNDMTKSEGDIYDRMIVLLRGLTTQHPFASGNRRTALFSSIHFLKANGIDVFIKNNPHNSVVLLALRNVPDYYSDEELKTWFQTGKIREYVRPYPKPKKKS